VWEVDVDGVLWFNTRDFGYTVKEIIGIGRTETNSEI